MKSIFADNKEIPHVPKVVQELISSFNDENTNIDDIATQVSHDASLTAKVLRLANSARYAGPREVASIHDAVLLLGFSTLRTMVLASGFSSTFKASNGFDPKTFWESSFMVAEIAKWAASFVKSIDNDVAFTCGMVHDIGSVLIRQHLPDESQRIDETLKIGGVRHELEKAQLGFDSAEVGAELARRWKFPDTIQHAIKHQHQPENDPYASLIKIADYLYSARKQGIGYAQIRADFPEAVADGIGLNTLDLFQEINTLGEIQNDMSTVME